MVKKYEHDVFEWMPVNHYPRGMMSEADIIRHKLDEMGEEGWRVFQVMPCGTHTEEGTVAITKYRIFAARKLADE